MAKVSVSVGVSNTVLLFAMAVCYGTLVIVFDWMENPYTFHLNVLFVFVLYMCV